MDDDQLAQACSAGGRALRAVRSLRSRFGGGRVRGQRGELLIESLVSIAIMSSLFVAALTAFTTLFASTALNQRIARASNEATSVAEAIERVPYEPCAASTAYTTSRIVRLGGAVADTTAPAWLRTAVSPKVISTDLGTDVDVNASVLDAIAGLSDRYALTVTKIEYLVSSTAMSSSFQSSCPGAGDQGVQRLTLRVASSGPDHPIATEVVFTKRNQTCPEAALRPAEIVDGQPC